MTPKELKRFKKQRAATSLILAQEAIEQAEQLKAIKADLILKQLPIAANYMRVGLCDTSILKCLVALTPNHLEGMRI